MNRSWQAQDLIDSMNVALIGPANSGKSTLMNLMTAENVSIVTSIPGTTRDYIEVNELKTYLVATD